MKLARPLRHVEDPDGDGGDVSRGVLGATRPFKPIAPQSGVAADPDAGGLVQALGSAAAEQVTVIALDFTDLKEVCHDSALRVFTVKCVSASYGYRTSIRPELERSWRFGDFFCL
jgi:hypothetical protein